jgi:GT2 family glycosyltransferase
VGALVGGVRHAGDPRARGEDLDLVTPPACAHDEVATAQLVAAVVVRRRLTTSDQGADLRLLVRDNGSTDDTAERVHHAAPVAEVYRGDNLGFAGGVNFLLARASAPWVFLLNSDAWPETGAIGRLVEAALADPRAAAVAPRIERPAGGLEHSTHRFPSLRLAAATAWGVGRLSAERADALLLTGAWLHDRPRVVDWAVGAALLLRRDALEDVGPLDDTFFMYAEDLDWCWRAHRRGWHVRFEPSAVVRHVGNASGSQRYGHRRARAHFASAYRFYRRTHGLPSVLALRGLHALGAARAGLCALLSGDLAGARAHGRDLLAHIDLRPDAETPRASASGREDDTVGLAPPRPAQEIARGVAAVERPPQATDDHPRRGRRRRLTGAVGQERHGGGLQSAEPG